MTDIVKTEAGLVPARGTRDEARLIRDQLAPKASDAEIRVFLALCQRLDLDPFARQIYLVGRWDSRARAEVYTPQVSIDGFRLVAQRTGEYAGQTSPEWCDESGAWRDVWLSDQPPVAARVGVYRRGWSAPLYRVALWSEFVQTHKDKTTGKPVTSPMWARMPSVMLAKCAEMQALRAAFPNELSGVHGVEEMAQATPVVEATREEPTHAVDVNGLISALGEADADEYADLRAEAKALYRQLSAVDKDRVSAAVKAAEARLTQPTEAAGEGSCGDDATGGEHE